MSLKSLMDLSGRKAIVTGGSRGLGLQMAEALGELGAELLVVARKPDELEQARAHLAAAGIKAEVMSADLSKAESVVDFAKAALARMGHVDILVNNAGAAWAAPAETHPLEGWLKLVNLNLTGVFLLTQAIGRESMIPRRYGRILNIASIAGLRGNPIGHETLAYNTTKGGLVNFTRALAGEWGEHGITVNAIAPGFFPSRLSQVALATIGDAMVAATPLHRLGGPEDLKGAAALFCSNAGQHITGQILAIDGGMTAI